MIQIIFSIVALLLAFTFTFIYPGSGVESMIVPIIAVLGSYFGINWRQQYEDLKNWYSSKTIVGSLVVVIPVLAIFIVNIFGIIVPEWLHDILFYIASAGGLGFLIGIVRAIQKNK